MLTTAFCGHIHAQTASSYTFSAFTRPSILPVGGLYGWYGCSCESSFDTANNAIISAAIGFTFKFCGVNYTSFNACANGFISLSNPAAVPYANTPDSITGPGMLMAYWCHLHGVGGWSHWILDSGIAPYRVFVFMWGESWFPYSFPVTGTPGMVLVRLYETTNVIEFCYDTARSPYRTTFSGTSATIGIANSTTDWQTLNNTSSVPTPSSSVWTDTLSVGPGANQVYRWTPPQCSGTPDAGAASATVTSGCTPYTPLLSLTDTLITPYGIRYQWESSPDGAAWTNISGTTNTTDSVIVSTTTYYRCVTTCTYSATSAASAPVELVLYPTPAGITGPSSVCQATVTTFSDATSGGTWSSGNTAVASVDPVSGMASALLPGTVTITYALAGGCSPATALITVYPPPSAITGTTHLCMGATTTLSDTTSGGTWSSTNRIVATVEASTGIVHGLNSGITTISYTLYSGCPALAIVTINPTPVAVTGASSVCAGATTTLTTGPGGGSWSSSDTTIATVGSAGSLSSGIVEGIAGGSATISYILPTGCSTSAEITVLPSPSAITGIMSTCIGATTALSDSSAGSLLTGGYWTSSNTAVAAIDPILGIVTGEAIGTTTVSYTLGTGCAIATTVTINNAPLPVSGTLTLCIGTSTSLSDAISGGSWSSGSTGVATVVGSASSPSTGTVYGVSAGTAIISYSVGTCAVTAIVTVNASPPAIRGVTEVCVGLATRLSDATTGGTWSSSSAAIASIVGATGILTGGAAGTATISYTLPDGCAVTTTETVNTTPSAITGIMQVCPGATTLLSDAGGGSWSSGNTAVAVVSGSAGAVSGVAVGTASIIYSIGAGCSISTTVTVNPLPAAISGIAVLCAGATTVLIDGAGTWSSSNTGIAIAGSVSGIVSGVGGGTAVVTYTAASTGCTAHATVTVNAQPAAITGTLTVCQGATTILNDHTIGGAWSSGITTIATTGSTGVVTGLSPGTAVISYTNSVTGCAAHTMVTVNSLLSAITGTLSICAGTTTTLLDATSGGLWTAAPGGIAIVSAGAGGAGAVTGVSAGTAVVSYTLPTGCASSETVTVNPLPTITGPTAECVGAVIGESAGSTGSLSGSGSGAWSSSTTTVATIGTSGSVTGVATGTTVITYTSLPGCKATTTITVSLSPGGIVGAAAVCADDTTTLSDVVGGGVWSSSNSGAATVGSLNGTVTGVAVGTTVITYSLGSTGSLSTGCTVTKVVTVNAAPASITGTTSMCIGATTTLADATTGGSWSSRATSTATITGTGIVIGGAAGIDTIVYTHGGCSVNTIVTVNLTPLPISGLGTVCADDSITLSDAISGGLWSAASSGIASVSATGNVAGISFGTTTVTYSLGVGCAVTKVITVNPISAITGSIGMCSGSTTGLSDATTGGVWSATAGGIATVNAAGIVTGISAGTSVITYTTATGCTATAIVTVNTAPSAIGGTLHFCAGATTALGNAAGGGLWTSGNTAVASVGSAGIVTGVIPGTTLITYSLGGLCVVVAVVTVDAVPFVITGAMSMCAGATTALSETPTGGLWSSGRTAIATVSSTGIVSGVSAGTATISYAFSTGCAATTTITVSPPPSPIAGATDLCAGLTTTLSSATTGGSWSSGSTAVASAGSGGAVSGVSPGTAVITYTLPSGCATSTSVTINAVPAAITGSRAMCEGSGTALGETSGSGVWSSSNAAVASVTSAGAVTGGVLSGTATISYTVGSTGSLSGCAAIAVVTVNTPPEPLSSTSLCVGSTEALTDLPAGGTWSSSNSAIAAIAGTSGIVTGVSAGTATIAYSLGAGCTVMATVTVKPSPGVIIGTTELCVGYTTSLMDAAGGGVWSSINTSIATVSGFGIVTGVAGGPASISYTSTSTGCSATRLVTVITVPAISGISDMCAFSSVATVSDAITGGTWTSTSVTVSTAGVVTPYSAGAASLTYTIPLGCYVTASFTVHPLPGPVTGISRFCRGGTVTLGDTTGGGVWSSGNSAIAPVSTSGRVSGLSAGIAIISYVLPSGCMETETITVDSFPVVGAITGLSSVCFGATITLTDLSAGGTWSSSNATASVLSGLVSGISAGTDTIKYTVNNTCGTASTSKAVTINPLPAAYSVTGGGSYCAGTSGVHIGLSGSNTGVNYQLYHGATLSGSVTGTGIAADFGLQTAAGIYTAVATNTSTGCTGNMLGTATVTVTPVVVPMVTIAPGTGDTICAGSVVTFTATPLNGGSLPSYQWLINNTPVPGVSGNSYTYTPANGDKVKALLISGAACALPDTVSDSTVMAVVTPVIPTVAINAAPGLNIQKGQSDTLTAIISGGGSTPVYQWEINGNPVPGATTASFINSYSSNDTVTCIVSVGGICNTEGSDSVVILVSNVGVQILPKDVQLTIVPNPNNGTFTIMGSLGTISDEEVSLEISDLLGQVIYKNKIIAQDGKLNEQIILSSALANGMYILSFHSASENRIFHIVIEQ